MKPLRRLRAWFAGLLALVALAAAQNVHASGHGHGGGAPKESSSHTDDAHGGDGHGGGEHGGHGEEAEEPIEIDPTQPRTVDLGEFEIHSFRPTHNDVTTIRFKLYLVVAKGTGEEMITRLNHWQRRFRDQAIIAVRLAEPADLLEPDLKRVQRLIIIRLKRLPFTDLIEGVYLTEFFVEKG